MGGTLTFPGGGAYHCLEYALEAFSDAMRFEVKAFGVGGILVQPGLIRTHLAAVGAILGAAATSSPYAGSNEAVAKATVEVYEKGPLAKLAGEDEDVARTIHGARAGRLRAAVMVRHALVVDLGPMSRTAPAVAAALY